jgi:hypothetical protein
MGPIFGLSQEMKKCDIDEERIKHPPYRSAVLLTRGNLQNQGFTIQHVELRQYVENYDPKLGYYSLITVLIKTDKGTAEIKYDEGFKGENALESVVELLTKYIGFSSIINRALIELQS